MKGNYTYHFGDITEGNSFVEWEDGEDHEEWIIRAKFDNLYGSSIGENEKTIDVYRHIDPRKEFYLVELCPLGDEILTFEITGILNLLHFLNKYTPLIAMQNISEKLYEIGHRIKNN